MHHSQTIGGLLDATPVKSCSQTCDASLMCSSNSATCLPHPRAVSTTCGIMHPPLLLPILVCMLTSIQWQLPSPVTCGTMIFSE
jgi:hypothetical protein